MPYYQHPHHTYFNKKAGLTGSHPQVIHQRSARPARRSRGSSGVEQIAVILRPLQRPVKSDTFPHFTEWRFVTARGVSHDYHLKTFWMKLSSPHVPTSSLQQLPPQTCDNDKNNNNHACVCAAADRDPSNIKSVSVLSVFLCLLKVIVTDKISTIFYFNFHKLHSGRFFCTADKIEQLESFLLLLFGNCSTIYRPGGRTTACRVIHNGSIWMDLDTMPRKMSWYS